MMIINVLNLALNISHLLIITSQGALDEINLDYETS